MKPSLTLTAALAPLAKEHGVDLTALALAEIEFERKLADTKAWMRSSQSDGRGL
jgi:hypothetical protein